MFESLKIYEKSLIGQLWHCVERDNKYKSAERSSSSIMFLIHIPSPIPTTHPRPSPIRRTFACSTSRRKSARMWSASGERIWTIWRTLCPSCWRCSSTCWPIRCQWLRWICSAPSLCCACGTRSCMRCTWCRSRPVRLASWCRMWSCSTCAWWWRSRLWTEKEWEKFEKYYFRWSSIVGWVDGIYIIIITTDLIRLINYHKCKSKRNIYTPDNDENVGL